MGKKKGPQVGIGMAYREPRPGGPKKTSSSPTRHAFMESRIAVAVKGKSIYFTNPAVTVHSEVIRDAETGPDYAEA